LKAIDTGEDMLNSDPSASNHLILWWYLNKGFSMRTFQKHMHLHQSISYIWNPNEVIFHHYLEGTVMLPVTKAYD